MPSRKIAWVLGLLFSTGLSSQALATAFFVAPKGSNNANGSLEEPLVTIERAEALAKPGDTVFIRGGTYTFKSADAEAGITLSQSGTPNQRRFYFAYPGEKPVFDFSGLTALKRIKGLWVKADWVHVKGIEMLGVQQRPELQAHENWCIYVQGGSHGIFENLDLHHNMGPGLFIVDGGANLVLNCDSHHNYDLYSFSGTTPTPGENADGFGFHSRNPADTGTVFRGCRAWWNADDGWDFINSYAPAVVEHSWAWLNGYKSGTTQSAGNGNGFKVGGFGLPPVVPPQLPRHTARFCVAFLNRAAGFYQNHHPVANFYYNNTSFNNKGGNFNLLGYGLANSDNKASMGVLRNNIAFTGTALTNANSGNGVDAKNNSWNLSVNLDNGDFESIDTTGVSGRRKTDGSLPDIPFLKLKRSSDLVDKGTNVGLPYGGKAPDLGAYETDLPVGVFTPNVHPRTRGSAPCPAQSSLRWLHGGVYFEAGPEASEVDLAGRQGGLSARPERPSAMDSRR